MPDALVLLLGIAAAAAGGELFVRGAVGLATWLRVPAAMIGATVAAFATSAPEFSVALNAAAAGEPEIPLGDALGSNVTNIALILGLALVIRPARTGRGEALRNLPFAMAAPAMTALLLTDGRLGRYDGVLLIAIFGTWLALTVRAAWRSRRTTPRDGEGRPDGARTVLICAGGLALLVVAGRLIVAAAEGIGESLGIDPFVVGVTMVAAGTSAPELATTIVATARGHSEIGLGTLVGSNIFNSLWIVGVTAVIGPIEAGGLQVAVAIVASTLVLALVIPGRDGRLGRRRGGLLMAMYCAYLAAVLAT